MKIKKYNEKHLEQMKEGYLRLLQEKLRKKAREKGVLNGVSRIAEVETIEDLINLRLKNEHNIKSDSMYAVEPFFDYENDKRVGLNLPAFFYVEQCEWNPISFSEKNGSTILVALDYASNYGPLRRSLLDVLCRNTSLLSEREIGFNMNWGVDITGTNKREYIILPCPIYGNEIDQKEEEIFRSNEQRIEDLIKVTERYTQATRNYEFHEEEANIVRLYYEIAERFVCK